MIGEICQGIERLRHRDPARVGGSRRGCPRCCTTAPTASFPVTAEVAEEWGRLNVPDPLPVIDGLMAAMAKVCGSTFVTRNVNDLARAGVRLLNPFDPRP